MLRYAALRVFMEKISKNSTKKILRKKKNLKFSVNFFFNFFCLTVFYVQFGACLRKFGGSRPAGLGGDRDCTNST
jgi:hypothetical protein